MYYACVYENPIINSYGTLHCSHWNLSRHVHIMFGSSNFIFCPHIAKPPNLLFSFKFFRSRFWMYFPFSLPNVATKWVALLFCIREVPGWNLGQEIVILTDMFRGFPDYLQACWANLTPSTSFLIRYVMLILPFGAMPVVWAIDCVVLTINKYK